jgi:hypothetical protein
MSVFNITVEYRHGPPNLSEDAKIFEMQVDDSITLGDLMSEAGKKARENCKGRIEDFKIVKIL